MFNPACLYCGARIIQIIGKLPISATQCATRRRAMLAVWMAQGHSEAQIRTLAKGRLCLGQDEATASEDQTPAKSASRGRK